MIHHRIDRIKRERKEKTRKWNDKQLFQSLKHKSFVMMEVAIFQKLSFWTNILFSIRTINFNLLQIFLVFLIHVFGHFYLFAYLILYDLWSHSVLQVMILYPFKPGDQQKGVSVFELFKDPYIAIIAGICIKPFKKVIIDKNLH